MLPFLYNCVLKLQDEPFPFTLSSVVQPRLQSDPTQCSGCSLPRAAAFSGHIPPHPAARSSALHRHSHPAAGNPDIVPA